MPATSPEHTSLSVDIVIIGGGAAGLWLLNRAVNAGYNAVLFEQTALGSDQSVASQGMIHGGVKYTLAGALSGASEAIADMPAHWQRCLAGTGDVDLRRTHVLSEQFYLWSLPTTASRLTAFLASKALRGRVDVLEKIHYPAIFNSPEFKGSLYQLNDQVIDAPSLIANLRDNCLARIFSIDWQYAQLQKHNDGARLCFTQANHRYQIDSSLCVLAAGAGNVDLLQKLGIDKPPMQLRPLQQVIVRHQNHSALFAHCVDRDSKPRLTISSHKDGDDSVWYLGGQLAEEGALMPSDVLMQRAQQELQALFPWLDWTGARYSCLRVDRAEPKQAGVTRPDNAFLSAAEALPRCLVAWPTKLALVPNLGNRLMQYLNEQHIQPRASDTLPACFPRMHAVALAPWQSKIETL